MKELPKNTDYELFKSTDSIIKASKALRKLKKMDFKGSGFNITITALNDKEIYFPTSTILDDNIPELLAVLDMSLKNSINIRKFTLKEMLKELNTLDNKSVIGDL